MKYEVLEKQYYDLLASRIELHPNDPRIKNYWDKMASVLSTNEDMTNLLVSNMTEENFVLLSEIFEDVSFRLKSKSFIDTLRVIQGKYKLQSLDAIIDIAEDAMSWGGRVNLDKRT